MLRTISRIFPSYFIPNTEYWHFHFQNWNENGYHIKFQVSLDLRSHASNKYKIENQSSGHFTAGTINQDSNYMWIHSMIQSFSFALFSGICCCAKFYQWICHIWYWKWCDKQFTAIVAVIVSRFIYYIRARTHVHQPALQIHSVTLMHFMYNFVFWWFYCFSSYHIYNKGIDAVAQLFEIASKLTNFSDRCKRALQRP